MVAGLALAATVPSAQGPWAYASDRTRGDGPFDRLVFRNIGPATPSGRVDDLAVLESNPAGWALADQVADAWTRFQSVEQQAKGATLPPALKSQMESLAKDLESVRRRLGLAGGGGGGFGGNPENVRGRIGQIKNGVMASTSLPTEVQLRQKRELEAAWPKVVADASAAMSRLANVAKDVVAAAFTRR